MESLVTLSLSSAIPSKGEQMPSTSKKQHNAMLAAAYGHSTLGIPKSVGKEFVAADKAKIAKKPASKAKKAAKKK